MVAGVLLLVCFADTFFTGLLLVKHQALVAANKQLTETLSALDHDVAGMALELEVVRSAAHE